MLGWMPQGRNPCCIGLPDKKRQRVERMTASKQNPMTRDEVIGLRGLRLPSAGLNGLQRAGIYCQPAISIEFQQSSERYLLRGVESGGAVPRIGAYCGFLDSSGGSLSTVLPVNAIGVNGLHAALLSMGLIRIQMFRAEIAYELLITAHRLVRVEGKQRPSLHNSILFHGRHGRLDMELWGKDEHLRGMVSPI